MSEEVRSCLQFWSSEFCRYSGNGSGCESGRVEWRGGMSEWRFVKEGR